MSSISNSLRRTAISIGSVVFGAEPRLHRIPFGPIKGNKIFTSFAISPRMFLGIDESRVIEWIGENVHPGDVVYDVGAHVGYTTVVLSRRVQENGQVHSFEILPSTADFLRKTVEANNLRNVRIHVVGLSDNEAEVSLPVQKTAMTSLAFENEQGALGEKCRVVPLDLYVRTMNLPPPGLVKIDIEGAEGSCLAGAGEVLRKFRPRMIIEFHWKDLLVEGFKTLHPLGYTMTMYSGEEVTEKFLAGCESFYGSVLCLP